MSVLQAGRNKVWDLMKSHSSVAIVIYRTDIKKYSTSCSLISQVSLPSRFVFVRQFRPAVYMSQAEENTGKTVAVGTRS